MSTSNTGQAEAAAVVGAFGESLDYVTVNIDEQLFGLPIARVQDVFIAHRITPVPRAPAEIIGLFNLRGRVVTAICLHRRLGRRPKKDVCGGEACELTAVGIDHEGEAYALVVDSVGEVMRLNQSTFEQAPVHLGQAWSGLAAGVHRLNERLLVVLDVDAVLKIDLQAAA